MSPFWVGVLVGMFIGCIVGVFVVALCVAADRADRQAGLK